MRVRRRRLRRGEAVVGWAALAAALGLTVVLASVPLSHDDLFQHLATGERIAATHRVPTTDFLSFTRGGERWVSHEWGFSLLVWCVWRASGMEGLLLLKVALVLTVAGVGLLLGKRLAGGAASHGILFAGPVLAVAAWAVSRELILRAALVGVLLFAATALALLAFRERPGGRRGGLVLLLFLIWANFHSGVIFGLFLLALFVADALLLRRTDPTRRIAPWVVLAPAAAAVTLINPNGLAAVLYPFRLARLLADPESGFTAGHFAGGWAGREGLLGLLALALLAMLLHELRRRKVSGATLAAGTWPLPLPWLMGAAVFALLSWRSSRLALEMVVMVAPAVQALVCRRLANPEKPGGSGWRFGAAAAGLAFAVLLATAVALARPPGVVSDHFPAGAVEFLRGAGVRGRIFHHQNWGGYLYWHLRQPIFWDGRNLVFAPLARQLRVTPFLDTVDRYGIGTLILSPAEAAFLEDELVQGPWHLAWADSRSAVYFREEAGAPDAE